MNAQLITTIDTSAFPTSEAYPMDINGDGQPEILFLQGTGIPRKNPRQKPTIRKLERTDSTVCGALRGGQLWSDRSKVFWRQRKCHISRGTSCTVNCWNCRDRHRDPTFIARNDVAENTALIEPGADAMKMIKAWIAEEAQGVWGGTRTLCRELCRNLCRGWKGGV